MEPEPEHLLDLVYRIAGIGVGDTPPAFDLARDEATWGALLALIDAKRLAGPLMLGIESGALEPPSSVVGPAKDLHARWMASCLNLDARLLEIVQLFEDHGLAHRVLKGAAAAHLDYPEPSVRSYGDVDLLIQGAQFDLAAELLEARGYVRRFPEPRPGFDRRFSKGAAFVAPDGIEVDLHRTLTLGPYGLAIELAELWSRADEFVLGGRRLQALDGDRRLIHACYHATLGDPEPRPMALRDVAQIGTRLSADDVAGAVNLAASWRGQAPVAAAVIACERRLGVSLGYLGGWARTFVPSRRDRRLLATIGGAYAMNIVASLDAIGGSRDRLAYLWALAFPTQRYVRARDASRISRVAAAMTDRARSARR